MNDHDSDDEDAEQFGTIKKNLKVQGQAPAKNMILVTNDISSLSVVNPRSRGRCATPRLVELLLSGRENRHNRSGSTSED